MKKLRILSQKISKKLFSWLLCGALIAACVPQVTFAATDEARFSSITIKAVNPGYTVDGAQNVGEMIEIARNSSSDEPISLAGIVIRYTNSNGTSSNLVKFPEGSQMAGEALLIRMAGTPDTEEAAVTYAKSKSLAMGAGKIELVYDDVIWDMVCWGGTEGCITGFNRNDPTSIVRDLETNTWTHVKDYVPTYDATAYRIVEDTSTTESVEARCRGLEITELLSYYENDKAEQFIELFNNNEEAMEVTGCTVKYKNKTYVLDGSVGATDYLVIHPNDWGFSLTKDPSSAVKVELIDVSGDLLDGVEYPHGQKKAASYAKFGVGSGAEWRVTYNVTMGAANIYQEYRSCPAGKVINEATGNCIKASTLKTVATDCPAGQYRNPETGRCKKYNTDEGPAECKEGYERNPETGRCRKIKNNNGADYAPTTPAVASQVTFVAFGVVAVLLLVGVGYVIWQYHKEIVKLIKRIGRKFKRGWRKWNRKE